MTSSIVRSASVSTSNFEQQCTNTLYVQYLLLSHLWQLTPLPYETVKGQLSALVNRRHIRFRENARLTSISLSKKRYGAAMKHACLALTASPLHLTKRLLYELQPASAVVNGDNPQRFRERKKVLWPTPCQIPNTTAEVIASAGRA